MDTLKFNLFNWINKDKRKNEEVVFNSKKINLYRYFIVVCGKVQGVGFRFFTNYTACNNALTGWVRNCEDGTVQMEIQGKEEDILKFIKIIKKGNDFSNIKDISISEISVIKSEKEFKLLYS